MHAAPGMSFGSTVVTVNLPAFMSRFTKTVTPEMMSSRPHVTVRRTEKYFVACTVQWETLMVWHL